MQIRLQMRVVALGGFNVLSGVAPFLCHAVQLVKVRVADPKDQDVDDSAQTRHPVIDGLRVLADPRMSAYSFLKVKELYAEIKRQNPSEDSYGAHFARLKEWAKDKKRAGNAQQKRAKKYDTFKRAADIWQTCEEKSTKCGVQWVDFAEKSDQSSEWKEAGCKKLKYIRVFEECEGKEAHRFSYSPDSSKSQQDWITAKSWLAEHRYAPPVESSSKQELSRVVQLTPQAKLVSKKEAKFSRGEKYLCEVPFMGREDQPDCLQNLKKQLPAVPHWADEVWSSDIKEEVPAPIRFLWISLVNCNDPRLGVLGDQFYSRNVEEGQITLLLERYFDWLGKTLNRVDLEASDMIRDLMQSETGVEAPRVDSLKKLKSSFLSAFVFSFLDSPVVTLQILMALCHVRKIKPGWELETVQGELQDNKAQSLALTDELLQFVRNEQQQSWGDFPLSQSKSYGSHKITPTHPDGGSKTFHNCAEATLLYLLLILRSAVPGIGFNDDVTKFLDTLIPEDSDNLSTHQSWTELLFRVLTEQEYPKIRTAKGDIEPLFLGVILGALLKGDGSDSQQHMDMDMVISRELLDISRDTWIRKLLDMDISRDDDCRSLFQALVDILEKIISGSSQQARSDPALVVISHDASDIVLEWSAGSSLDVVRVVPKLHVSSAHASLEFLERPGLEEGKSNDLSSDDTQGSRLTTFISELVAKKSPSAHGRKELMDVFGTLIMVARCPKDLDRVPKKFRVNPAILKYAGYVYKVASEFWNLGYPLSCIVEQGELASQGASAVVQANRDDVLQAVKEFVLKAVAQNGLALEHAPKLLQAAERNVVVEAVKQNGCALQHASEEFKGQKELVMEAVTQNGRALEYASENLTDNEDVVTKAVEQDGYALQYASENLTDNEDVVMKAVEQDGYALQYASKDLKGKENLVMKAVIQDGEALQFASEDLKGNENLVMKAVIQDGYALQFASKKLQKTREVVMEAMKQHLSAFSFAHKDLQNDPNFAIELLKNLRVWDAANIFEHLTPEMQKTKEVVKEFVKDRDGLRHVSPEMQKDKDVVMVAVKHRGLALGFAHKDLHKDMDVVMEAVKNDGRALGWASEELQKNPAVVMEAVKQNGCALKFARKLEQADRKELLQVVEEAMKQSREACASETLKKSFPSKFTEALSAFFCCAGR